jgi:hypothetical protein
MAAETLLALWNDTPTRRAIVDFVQAVSTEGSPGFVAPAELAGQNPSLAERQPYRRRSSVTSGGWTRRS